MGSAIGVVDGSELSKDFGPVGREALGFGIVGCGTISVQSCSSLEELLGRDDVDVVCNSKLGYTAPAPSGRASTHGPARTLDAPSQWLVFNPSPALEGHTRPGCQTRLSMANIGD